jgi:hypothetical protein
MSNPLLLTSKQLKRAADLKDRIGALEKELVSILGSSSNSAPAAPKKKFTMSAAARAKIAAAQRARWAKAKRKKPAAKSAAKSPAKKSRRSAAVRARLSALAKARWARVKAAGRKAL